jgi:23S rRNA (guanosine2251-2'-O)-methyltransferase
VSRIVYGIHPVTELLRVRPESVLELRYSDAGSPAMRTLLDLAQQARLRTLKSDRNALARFANADEHQGVAALAQDYRYTETDEMLAMAKEAGRQPLLVALDNMQDPHNMGSIMRSAWLLGAHGLIFPKDRSARVTPAVCKASSGAVEHLKTAMITNLARTLGDLKEAGLWIVGTDMSGGKPPQALDLKLPIVLVVGGEGEGMRRLTIKTCDFIATVPSRDASFSFNASVAAALILAEAARQRTGGGEPF